MPILAPLLLPARACGDKRAKQRQGASLRRPLPPFPAPPHTIDPMSDLGDMARDPKHRRRFEKLLHLAAQRGDADLVAERLSWGIDPNCVSPKGRTPLIANA